MKKIFLLLVIMATLNATQIDDFAKDNGYERSYEIAKAKAIKSNKPIMLLVVADYCPWCKKFERKVLEDEQIKADLAKEFVPIIIDKVKDSGTYPETFNAKLIPTLYFIDPKNDKKLYEIIAYHSKKEFKDELEKLHKELK